MEKMEKLKTPEIHPEELLQRIEQVKWEDMEGLEYNGINFLLFWPEKTSESDGHRDAVFQASDVADFDIYILSSLPVLEKKRRLFHEVLEASLRRQGYNGNEAHSLAETEEQKIFNNKEK
jgi:hypothetical protein